jgi:hypothetical protein
LNLGCFSAYSRTAVFAITRDLLPLRRVSGSADSLKRALMS